MQKLILCLIFLICFAPMAYGVSATITVPSSDSLAPETVMLKDVTVSRPNTKRVITTPSFNIGLPYNQEVGIGVPVSISTQTGETDTQLLIEYKKVFNVHENTDITLGTAILPYLNHSYCPDGFIYGHVTQRITKTKTSISLGGYATGQRTLVDSGGILLVGEQTLSNKVKLQMEYLSGNNNRSSFNVGLKYKPSSQFAISASTLVPTHGQNIGFQLIISKNFKFPVQKQER